MQQVSQIEASQTDVILQSLEHILAEVTRLRDQVVIMQSSNQQNSDPDFYRPIEEEEFFGMWADREDMKGKTSLEWLQEQRKQSWNRRHRIEDASYFGMWTDREDMKGKTSQEWLDELRREQWRRDERTGD